MEENALPFHTKQRGHDMSCRENDEFLEIISEQYQEQTRRDMDDPYFQAWLEEQKDKYEAKRGIYND